MPDKQIEELRKICDESMPEYPKKPYIAKLRAGCKRLFREIERLQRERDKAIAAICFECRCRAGRLGLELHCDQCGWRGEGEGEC